MESLMQDVRYAMRTLARDRAFATITILTLALGIGATVAIFGVVDAVLLRPLPFHEPNRLVRVFDDAPGAGARDIGMSVPELIDLGERAGVFEQISALVPVSAALAGGDRIERIELLGTDANYFELLGVGAALGRVYGQAEWRPGFLDGVVISDAIWRRQFGADPNAIGRSIRLDEDPYTIIGVTPPEFRHPGNTLQGDVEIWAATGWIAPPFPSPPIRGARFLPGALGRLKSGITLEQANQRLAAFATRLTQAYPSDYPEQLRWTLRLQGVQTTLTGNVRPLLVILLAAVGWVLLIVCVNVASVLLARVSARTREFALRQALGASAGRLARQLLTESLVLSVIGGATAIVCLRLTRGALLAMVPPDIPRLTEIRTDWQLVGFALGISVVTGVLVGLTPAFQTRAVDPVRGLNEGGRSGGEHGLRVKRSRALLVIAEIAISVVLLVGAGLLVRSFTAVLRQDPGLQSDGLVAGQVWVPLPNNPQANRYLTPAQQAGLIRRLLDQLATLPRVHAAVASSGDLPFVNATNNALPFSLPDERTTRAADHAAQFGTVSASYFDVLETPVLRGRVFTDHDDAQAPNVAVVNQAFVRRFAPGRNLVGERLRSGSGADVRIIGVVGDVRYDGLDVLPEPHVYMSIMQQPMIASTFTLAVFLRTQEEVAVVRAALTQTVRLIDPMLPVFGVRTMDDLMSASMERRRFSLTLMSLFALSALVLAAMGMYGVMAILMSQRAQEFGVRQALGAEARDILRLALVPALRLTALGTAVGLAAALAATRLMSTLVFGVSSIDPATYVAVPILLTLVALAACFVPARRATRVSPMEALRS